MKLQVKFNGSWRDVCTFDGGHTAIVQDAAWRIAMCTPTCSWRMQPVVGDPLYLDRQARTWLSIKERSEQA